MARRAQSRPELYALIGQLLGVLQLGVPSPRPLRTQAFPPGDRVQPGPQAIRVGRERFLKNLERDITQQARIVRLIDLSHSAGADERNDFVRTELGIHRERHGLRRLYP